MHARPVDQPPQTLEQMAAARGTRRLTRIVAARGRTKPTVILVDTDPVPGTGAGRGDDAGDADG